MRGHLLSGFPWNAFGYALTEPLALEADFLADPARLAANMPGAIIDGAIIDGGPDAATDDPSDRPTDRLADDLADRILPALAAVRGAPSAT